MKPLLFAKSLINNQLETLSNAEGNIVFILSRGNQSGSNRRNDNAPWRLFAKDQKYLHTETFRAVLYSFVETEFGYKVKDDLKYPSLEDL